mmetsp:Transcript_19437/g.60368  ORF Transcript_19437/g.60368 Transcript_19437/m.60368 type:complete len:409 (-) Transcript_19437:253-1479(-)
MTIVVPARLLMFSRRSITSIVVAVSRSPVGSSSSSTAGLFASERAMVTRCCSPPESSEGRWCTRLRRPTRPSSCLARDLRCFSSSSPSRAIGSSTFSNADIVGIRLNVWNTKPMCFRRRSLRKLSSDSLFTSVPMSLTQPSVGQSMVPIMFSNVVLPPPDGPRIITNSPRRIGGKLFSISSARLMQRRAVTVSPSLPCILYCFVTPRTSTTTSPSALPAAVVFEAMLPERCWLWVDCGWRCASGNGACVLGLPAGVVVSVRYGAPGRVVGTVEVVDAGAVLPVSGIQRGSRDAGSPLGAGRAATGGAEAGCHEGPAGGTGSLSRGSSVSLSDEFSTQRSAAAGRSAATRGVACAAGEKLADPARSGVSTRLSALPLAASAEADSSRKVQRRRSGGPLAQVRVLRAGGP